MFFQSADFGKPGNGFPFVITGQLAGYGSAGFTDNRVPIVIIRHRDRTKNKIKIGRNAIGLENITTVHLVDEDPHPFRVGNEKDTVEWLRGRFGK